MQRLGLRDRNRRQCGGETDRVEMKEAALIRNKCSDVTLLSCSGIGDFFNTFPKGEEMYATNRNSLITLLQYNNQTQK